MCNGDDDCGNNEDEPTDGLCERNECEVNNGGCAHNCTDTKGGYYCSCRDGFMLVNNTMCEGNFLKP